MSKPKSSKKYSKYKIGEQIIVTKEDGGISVGYATILDNLKVKRNGKYTNKVQDSFGKVGFVKLKYIK